MSKHTPGPWFVSGVRQRGLPSPTQQYLTVQKDGFGILAYVPYSDRSHEQHVDSHADARLFAAAPEVLEVLKDAIASADPDQCSPWIARALAAIAKAEGK